MTRYRVINSLSYLSVLFLPVLFPLIVWVLTGDQPEIRRTAGRAFWLQLIPAILGIGALVMIGVTGFYWQDASKSGWLVVILLALLGLVALASYLWSIVRGIQILISD
ncbi:DUF4870 domain-containing protein [Lactiplantibacillus mudanjiangensis]|uniref:Integral membrane protein (Putative) [Lactobacillus plantarum JDM1] n=1 Tax=Lactiplantibacillus mudanjiangensis TaxID=1296538 RepID=A0A660DUA0_9LACO|nr:DUF4870 domain-containing protein [Lactiplantibacillus mudanjiangensis]VDG21306.1 integral membrane protein (putative) [Lactobacillus plantarum JDM1] [Lactiplantibacillus mudanjiangensis]VDG23619.1 integral membrane protein (putative) [Lactobacillus plantarum JDM1] [Lactiplantibacillus mudanjiangensis]VDG27042.1 integral membrane protein (putative) [Lactobacillus plantarum JDM1] [Lactiplantibacillus mudanjiangensis]VDG32139.1 integral membrane protein (putative) [Lactobacillus plantarum JDM1